MLLFYNSNGDLLKSVLEPVYQGSNRANEIYLVAPISANNTIWATYTLPNGEVGNPRLMVITQAPETIPDNAFGSFRVWHLLLDNNITEYIGDVKMSFFASNNLSQDETNITFEEIFIPIKKGSSISLPSGALPSDSFKEILNYLGEIQSSIMKNADDIEEINGKFDEVNGKFDEVNGEIAEVEEKTQTNKNNIEALTERVNTQQLSINNAVYKANYSKELATQAKEVAEDSFAVSASNTTRIVQNATRINQLNDKIAVLEGANAYLIVSELPTANINPKIIYLLPATDSENNNVYEEYIYVNNTWELIGTTKTDLSNLNYNYLLNTPIYNSYNGLDYEPSEAVFNPLPKPCYMRFTGETDTSRGLENGKIYYVEEVLTDKFNTRMIYRPIDGSKPVVYYNELSGIPIYLSWDGANAGTGENLINLQPGDYFKYTGNGEDGKGLTNGVIYLIGTKEVEGVISPTYTPINGQTKVIVNGEVVSEFNADTKVDKINPPVSVNGASYAYGTNITSKASGSVVTQNLIEYSSSSKASTIPLRGGSGNFYIGEPTLGGHCATKNYVDSLALYKHNITITGKRYRSADFQEDITIHGFIINKDSTLITTDYVNEQATTDTPTSEGWKTEILAYADESELGGGEQPWGGTILRIARAIENTNYGYSWWIYTNDGLLLNVYDAQIVDML